MSVVSFPVTRPIGRALVVANSSSRAPLVEMLSKVGFDCGECDDPYTAALELSRRRLAYRAVILSLNSLFREELALIQTIKRRFPHLEIWLTHTDGRTSTLAEAIRLGADGLVDEEGPHRIGAAPPPLPTAPGEQTYHAMPHPLPPSPMPAEATEQEDSVESSAEPAAIGEPVLTAEELRALLADQTAMPPSGGAEGQQ
jgi:hypothetical protein